MRNFEDDEIVPVEIEIDYYLRNLRLWLSVNVSPKAAQLYEILRRTADAHPNRKTISDSLRCSVYKLRKIETELVEAGLLSIQQTKGDRPWFTLLPPAPCDGGCGRMVSAPYCQDCEITNV